MMDIEKVFDQRTKIEVTFDETIDLREGISQMYFISNMLESQNGVYKEMADRIRTWCTRFETIVFNRIYESFSTQDKEES